MENWQYLVSAYSIAWAGLAYYVFRNITKVRRVEQRIEDLEGRFRKQ